MPQFGRVERCRYIRARLEEWGDPSVENAWRYVYRLLAWTADHNGLLHIYDAHKAKDRSNAWFLRSRIATELVCRELHVTYAELHEHVDLLFRQYIAGAQARGRLPPASDKEVEVIGRLFAEPRTPDALPRYADLAAQLGTVLRAADLPKHSAQELAYSAASYFSNQKGARQNTLGEGFEDVVGLLLERLAPPSHGSIYIGRPLEEVEGFGARPKNWPAGRHIPRPDVAFSNRERKRTEIVTLKWSLRHDREGTFREEVEANDVLLLAEWDYGFSVLTNDFDLGRLHRLVQFGRPDGRRLFDKVYHVNLQLLLAVHRSTTRGKQNSLEEVERHVVEGRLGDLSDLLVSLRAHA